MQEIPPLVWCSIFVFLFVFVWVIDFGEKTEAKRRGPVIVYSVFVLLAWAFMADYVHGFSLWESDGERAVKEAQAESIRLEAHAQYQRELALLRSQGHRPEPADKSAVWPFLFAGIAGLAIIWAYIENRWREQRDAEIRRLQYQIAIAERQGAMRIPFYGFEKTGRVDR